MFTTLLTELSVKSRKNQVTLLLAANAPDHCCDQRNACRLLMVYFIFPPVLSNFCLKWYEYLLKKQSIASIIIAVRSSKNAKGL